MSETKTNLAEAKTGVPLRVLQIEGGGDLAARLTSFGFWPETAVEVVRRSPFGDPLQVRLRGLDLALRREEARRVVVIEVTS